MMLLPISRDLVREELAAWVELLRAEFRDATITESQLGEVRASDELLVADVRAMGCAGLLVHRATKSAFWMSTPTPVEIYLWAYVRGVYLGGDNVVVIDGVADVSATNRVLMKGLKGRAVLMEIEPLLRDPVALHIGWQPMSLLLEGLERVERDGAPFRFSINPNHPPAVRWPADTVDQHIKSPWARQREQ